MERENKRRKKVLVATLVLGVLCIAFAGRVRADGGYAWGDKMSWVNFGASSSNVQVTNNAVTGYAWSENFGWINLAPSGSGVFNDGLGDLSGYAWGQNVGWVDFLGVTISNTGTFSGIASGTVAGNLSFSCANCGVNTSWRAVTSSPVSILNTNLNGASAIVLTPNATTSVNVSATVNDTSGCSAITGGTTTIMLYRSSIGSSTCIANANNADCYVATGSPHRAVVLQMRSMQRRPSAFIILRKRPMPRRHLETRTG